MKETSEPKSLTLRLFSFSQKHPVLIIVLTAVITLGLGYFAAHVRIRSEVEDLIPKDEKMTRLIEKYRGSKTDTNYVMLAVERDDPFAPEALKAFAAAIEQISELPTIKIVLNPFNVLGFRKQGSKLEIVVPADGPPEGPAEIEQLKTRLLNDPIARGLLISGLKRGTFSE